MAGRHIIHSAKNRRARAAMVRIDDLLRLHLGDEERLILPVAGEAFTQTEWNRSLFPQLGFMIDALGPAEGAQFIRTTLPAPVRLLWQLVGRGQYRRYQRQIYGREAMAS